MKKLENFFLWMMDLLAPSGSFCFGGDLMGIEHLNLVALEREGKRLIGDLTKYVQTVQSIAAGEHFGKLGQKADLAYAVIKSHGRFTSFDAAKVGVFDTTHKKRLFEVLGDKYPDVKVKIAHQQGDKRKIYVAALNEQTLAEVAEGSDLAIKDFIKAARPTRDQLVAKFGWNNEQANAINARLIKEGKVVLDPETRRYKWVE